MDKTPVGAVPSSPPRAVPQGLLPTDMPRSYALETWQEFGASFNASGLREKLAEQRPRKLWEEFIGRREEAGE